MQLAEPTVRFLSDGQAGGELWPGSFGMMSSDDKHHRISVAYGIHRAV